MHLLYLTGQAACYTNQSSYVLLQAYPLPAANNMDMPDLNNIEKSVD